MRISDSSTVKIVWLCHFSDAQIRSLLPLKAGSRQVDFAPWIPSSLAYMKEYEDIDLHIISPHRGLKRLSCTFQKDRITYHFFSSPDRILRAIARKFGISWAFMPYIYNMMMIRRMANKLKPDLVNLHGAENPYYSAAILWLKRFPVYVCIQGIYSDPKGLEHSGIAPEPGRAMIERRIHSTFRYFGVRVDFMRELILKDNPAAMFFEQRYAIEHPKVCALPEEQKKYDCVFFARTSKLKGIEDLLRALAIVKEHRDNVTLAVLGPCADDYSRYLKQLAIDLKIEANVEFLGHYPLLDDVHKIAAQARISILPTYVDNISGTILESILIGLPVISYRTGLIPSLNEGEERIIILEKGDVQGIAASIVRLLGDKDLSRDYAQKAKSFILEKFDNHQRVQSLVNDYYNILKMEGKL